MGTKPTDEVFPLRKPNKGGTGNYTSEEPRGARRTQRSRESRPPPAAEPQIEVLKLCPFDGGKAELDYFVSRKFPYRVGCIRCFVSTPGFRYSELAVEAWNRRV